MPKRLSIQEINPCIRTAGKEIQTPNIGPMRIIYDYEFIYCAKGSFGVNYAHKSLTIYEGQILIIPPLVLNIS